MFFDSDSRERSQVLSCAETVLSLCREPSLSAVLKRVCLLLDSSIHARLLLNMGYHTHAHIHAHSTCKQVQFHVSFSHSVKGVGVFAGGPFYCAEVSDPR